MERLLRLLFLTRPVLPCLTITPSSARSRHSAGPFSLAHRGAHLKHSPALGVMHGVKGSPRCPKISVQAHGAWAYVRGSPWGPAHARAEQRNLWTAAVVHANHIVAHAQAPGAAINASTNHAARLIVQAAGARFIDSQAEPAHGTRSSLYAILWHLRYANDHLEWNQERSAARRWAPGDSSEWLALAEARNMTDATRLLRLLCNALPGRARWRASSQRAPHKCHACGSHKVQLVWRSPSPIEVGAGDDGMAWCTNCVHPGMTEISWAHLPVHMTPSSLREQAHLISSGLNRVSFDTRHSHFGPCPLCGLGEAGAEHIWQWCSAAHMAWDRDGDGTSWRDALAGRCNDKLRLTIVASQVVVLYTSLFGRTCGNPDDSSRRIVLAVRAIVATGDIPIEDGGNGAGVHMHVGADTWAPSLSARDATAANQTFAASPTRLTAQTTPGPHTLSHTLVSRYVPGYPSTAEGT